MNGPIKFIYFDLGNVLLKFDHRRAARQIADVAGITTEEAWDAVFGDGLELQYERGELTTRQFYDRFCERTNTRADHDALLHASADIFEPDEATLSLVQRLRREGQRVGILSNTNDAHWRFIRAEYSFAGEWFETHALSFELGLLKPEPQIYAKAARLAGVAPSEVFFTDDRAENVEGARQAGFHAELFSSAEELMRPLRDAGLLDTV